MDMDMERAPHVELPAATHAWSCLASQEREQAAIRLAGMGTHALKGDRGYQEDRVIALTLRGSAARSMGRRPERFVGATRGTREGGATRSGPVQSHRY